MSFCKAIITRNIELNCENPIVAGIEANGVIINRKDIDFERVEFDPENRNIIASLPIKDHARAFHIHMPTNQPFNGTTTTLEEGTNRKTFTNNVGFVILDNAPEVCESVIDGLANGEFIVIFENKYKNFDVEGNKGASTFQIMGYYQGLKASSLENDKYSEDTEGGWNVVLTETKVPKSALFFYAGTYKDSRENFDGLLLPCPTAPKEGIEG